LYIYGTRALPHSGADWRAISGYLDELTKIPLRQSASVKNSERRRAAGAAERSTLKAEKCWLIYCG